MKEIYKMVKIDEFPEYLISKCGKVYSTYKNRYLNSSINGKNKSGYYCVKLTKNKKQYTFKIHRLLGIAFIENPKPDEYNKVDHINNDRLDNRLENLRWCNYNINNRNQQTSIINTSGFQGVQFHKNRNYYRARWTDNEGKTHEKSFSLNKYDNAKELAIEYRQKMVDKYYNRLNNM